MPAGMKWTKETVLLSVGKSNSNSYWAGGDFLPARFLYYKKEKCRAYVLKNIETSVLWCYNKFNTETRPRIGEEKEVDYKKEILILLENVKTEDTLKRVYRLLVYLYLKEDESG